MAGKLATPGDRTLTVPLHKGDTLLPNLPFFEKLLRYAHRRPPTISIRDVNAGVEKSYTQLLTDALALRRALRGRLSPETLRDLDNDHEVFVAVIAPGGYEYAVAFTAILALGAAVVPISMLALGHTYLRDSRCLTYVQHQLSLCKKRDRSLPGLNALL
jgi:acyl-CoA synthetase (AMP-forming)/AMP-acid ligase II